jgi:hypothetical protein
MRGLQVTINKMSREVIDLTSDTDEEPECEGDCAVHVVVTRMYTRLRQMCEPYGIRRATMSPDLHIHGKNIVLLLAAIPRVLQSQEISNTCPGDRGSVSTACSAM